jgi:hypothetical protein
MSQEMWSSEANRPESIGSAAAQLHITGNFTLVDGDEVIAFPPGQDATQL